MSGEEAREDSDYERSIYRDFDNFLKIAIKEYYDRGWKSRKGNFIALLIASGLTDRQIAERLTVSWHTARTHSERALRKLGASTRAEVATRIFSA